MAREKNEGFRFKRFSVKHTKSSMKVSVESVLLGCWVDVSDCRRILDVGTGCGLLALICAQRTQASEIVGIDIDEPSIEEADSNFKSSPWSSRLLAKKCDFNNYSGCNIDLIISNPPYFDAGIEKIESARIRARHQCSLSPLVLLSEGKKLLNANGRIAMIIPLDREKEVGDFARHEGFSLKRMAYMRGREDLPPKRVLLEFEYSDSESETKIDCKDYDREVKVENIFIEKSVKIPSDKFKNLCGDFYLNF